MDQEIVKEGIGSFTSGSITITGKIILKWNINKVYRKSTLIIELVSDVSNSFQNLPFAPWDFSGRIDNELVNASNIALLEKGGMFGENSYSKFVFSVDEVSFGKKSSEYASIEYFVPNFLIGYTDVQKIEDDLVVNKTSFELPVEGVDYDVIFEGINNSVQNRQDYINRDETLLSTKITFRRKDGKEFQADKTLFAIERILELCSIAYGGETYWVASIAYGRNQEQYTTLQVQEFSKIWPTRRLMKVEGASFLSDFVIKSLPKYMQLTNEKRQNIVSLIASIHLSAENLVFPTPFIVLGSAIEDFVTSVLPEKNAHFLVKSDRDKLFPSFETWVKGNLIATIGKDDQNDFCNGTLKQKFSGLLQRSLRTRINAVLHEYNVTYDAALVGSFVNKRNSTAHGNYIFEGAQDFMTWSRMASCFEVIVLNILEYKSEYLDWTINPPQWKNNS